MADMWKDILKNVLLGSVVVAVTPVITVIPEIVDLKVITLGAALTAGLVAWGTNYLIEKFM